MITLETIKNFWIDMVIQRSFLGGRVKSIDSSKGIYDTVSTGYDAIHLIFFKYFKVSKSDIIVDVGCGKGRVFNYLLYKGLRNKMIGYEINEEVAVTTKKNLSRFKNVTILSEDIFNNFPSDTTLFYLFNPFNSTVMQQFVDNMLKMKDKKPVILYYNPSCIHLYDNSDFVYDLIDLSKELPGYPHKFALIRMT